MRFDLDCVRDILLTLEEKLEYGEDDYIREIHFNELVTIPPLSNYSRQTVLYACDKLAEGGYIEMVNMKGDNRRYFCAVTSVTYNGHQFLENIRQPEVWTKVKEIGAKIGASSLTLIAKIASNVLSDLIQGKSL